MCGEELGPSSMVDHMHCVRVVYDFRPCQLGKTCLHHELRKFHLLRLTSLPQSSSVEYVTSEMVSKGITREGECIMSSFLSILWLEFFLIILIKYEVKGHLARKATATHLLEYATAKWLVQF